jgi:hypothetical protein
MHDHDFSKCLDSIQAKIDSMMDFVDLDDLNFEASSQQKALESSLFRKKGQPYARQRAGQLASQIRGFRFWLARGIKPDGLTDNEFSYLRPICKILVDKGAWEASALDEFKIAQKT